MCVFVLQTTLHACWTLFSLRLKLFSPVLICVWLIIYVIIYVENRICISTNTDKMTKHNLYYPIKHIYCHLLLIIWPKKIYIFCLMRQHPAISTQGQRRIHVHNFTLGLHLFSILTCMCTVTLTLKIVLLHRQQTCIQTSVFNPLSSTFLFRSFVLCYLPLLSVPL